MTHTVDRTLGEVKVAEILSLYASGASAGKIAPSYGISHQALLRLLKRRGVKIRHRAYYRIRRITTIKVCSDPVALGYVAGLLDGEGSIGSEHDGTDHHNVTIANTNMAMLMFVKEKFGGKIVGMRPDPRGVSKLPIYQWKIQSFIDIVTFLEQIVPYMKHNLKRPRAQQVLDYCRGRLSETRFD